MESGSSRADYGPAVLATFLWAGAARFLAVAFGLPLLIIGLVSIIGCTSMTGSIGPIAVGLICLAVGGLVLYGVLRSTFLSVVRVWRSPGYPDRHWSFVRRSFRNSLRTELILLAAVFAAMVWAYQSDGRLAARADFAVGVAGAIFVYYQLAMVASLNDTLRHASVVPYFRRRVGEITTYSSGESLARHVDELDEVARARASPRFRHLAGTTISQARRWNGTRRQTDSKR